jgi:hypothetical protein
MFAVEKQRKVFLLQNQLMRFVFCYCLPLLLACKDQQHPQFDIVSAKQPALPIDWQRVQDIPPPAGFERLVFGQPHIANYLRNIALKKDKTVYLFDGCKKRNQNAQFAVLDISVGQQNLQQCADACMRLRAEYFFARHQYDSIVFKTAEHDVLAFDKWAKGQRFAVRNDKLVPFWSTNEQMDSSKTNFMHYLQFVFNWCGTASCEQQMRCIPLSQIAPGDLFIKGGYPGHAVTVMDVAMDPRTGKKIFLLAQSYMPAQDIHLLKNPMQEGSPWFDLAEGDWLYTPEWVFEKGCLRRW